MFSEDRFCTLANHAEEVSWLICLSWAFARFLAVFSCGVGVLQRSDEISLFADQQP